MASKIILDFNPEWIQEYKKGVERLKRLGLPGVVAIYHIGSTSIKMKARPIIDILMVCKSGAEVDQSISILLTNGFNEMDDGGVLGLRRLCFPARVSTLQIHLHLFPDGNPHIARYLLFRNYLRTHKDVTEQYENAKVEASNARAPLTALDAKQRFIKYIDRLALDSHTGPLPHWNPPEERLTLSMNVDAIRLAITDNLYLEMTFLSYFLNKYELLYIGDASILVSDLDSDLYNFVVRANMSEHIELKARNILQVFAARRTPFSWWIGPCDHPEDLAPRLLPLGLHQKAICYGMYVDLFSGISSNDFLEDNTITTNNDFKNNNNNNNDNNNQASEYILDIREVRSHDHLSDFDRVHVDAGLATGAFQSLYVQCPVRLLANDSPLQGYVGYLQDIPVVTGLLVLHAGVAGMYHIATVASEMHKGHGECMIRHLFTQARSKGYRYGCILVEPKGQGIYRALGFQPVCTFTQLGVDSTI